jgi:phosphoribosylformylglycinamidine synthase
LKYNYQSADLNIAISLGLIEEEFLKIQDILGRKPNFTELSIFSVMWSEHCSYKNSIIWLKKLPKKGSRILAEAGEENAGLVDIGDDLACVFKIESHNHPSAIEPYQGAATGVGGINRDIFTMGARPVAQLNSLRFGELDSFKTQWLMKGVVKGIGDYGNAFGIPTVGGEVFFDKCYSVNPLVNAMSVGIVKKGETVSATSYGEGNRVYIVGSATGKDGIHGAAFASKDITADSAKDLPSVQVGDPFQEKLLLEASLEVIQTGAIIGMQDMGAAGIICSTSEMSAKGMHGMDIDLDKVPLRNASMQPYEILLSESQERMLLVVKKGMEAQVEEIFSKWDLNCADIGMVTLGNDLRFSMGGESVAMVPANPLVLGGGAPVYTREYSEPAYYLRFQNFKIENIIPPSDLIGVARKIMENPNIASKKWVSEQYDSTVGTANFTSNRPSDAALVFIKGSEKQLALTVDCNARYVHADPFKGTMIAVSEAARNITCSGASPVAITNCLNFGNPYQKEVYWQFVRSIEGMAEACTRLDTPVTGGNVSFYNQSADGGAVFPTPTIGMLGILEKPDHFMGLDFKNPGDIILILGPLREDISSSEYLYSVLGVEESPAPYFDMDTEIQVQKLTRELILKGLIGSAHDISEGGLFVALTESSFAQNLGFSIHSPKSIRLDAFLFGEGQSRILISLPPKHWKESEDFIIRSGVEFQKIGEVQKNGLIIDDVNFGNIEEYRSLYENSLSKRLNS